MALGWGGDEGEAGFYYIALGLEGESGGRVLFYSPSSGP